MILSAKPTCECSLFAENGPADSEPFAVKETPQQILANKEGGGTFGVGGRVECSQLALASRYSAVFPLHRSPKPVSSSFAGRRRV